MLLIRSVAAGQSISQWILPLPPLSALNLLVLALRATVSASPVLPLLSAVLRPALLSRIFLTGSFIFCHWCLFLPGLTLLFESHILTKPCTSMFIAALLVIVKSWKQPKCPSTGERINRLWYTHTRKYYSPAIKRNELSTHTTWMNRKDMLSERSQSQKHIYCIVAFIWHSPKDKTAVIENKSAVSRGYGWGQLWLQRGNMGVLEHDGTVLFHQHDPDYTNLYMY